LKIEHQILPDFSEIIDGCKKGNRKFQEKLYGHFASKMFAVCMRYAPSREDAEDLLQEGFLKVFNSIDGFKNEGSFEGWIRRIFVHTTIEFFRKNSKMHPMIELNPVLPEAAVSEDIFSTINANELMKMVQRLSDGYRITFNLYAVEGFTHREIGEMLNINEGTSKSQVARARILLQKMLSDHTKKNFKNDYSVVYER